MIGCKQGDVWLHSMQSDAIILDRDQLVMLAVIVCWKYQLGSEMPVKVLVQWHRICHPGIVGMEL